MHTGRAARTRMRRRAGGRRLHHCIGCGTAGPAARAGGRGLYDCRWRSTARMRTGCAAWTRMRRPTGRRRLHHRAGWSARMGAGRATWTRMRSTIRGGLSGPRAGRGTGFLPGFRIVRIGMRRIGLRDPHALFVRSCVQLRQRCRRQRSRHQKDLGAVCHSFLPPNGDDRAAGALRYPSPIPGLLSATFTVPRRNGVVMMTTGQNCGTRLWNRPFGADPGTLLRRFPAGFRVHERPGKPWFSGFA
jgi:hypothetical protein